MSAVSVIIPTYNRAHTLPRALDSVLAQTYPPDEIIVVDDGSTDATELLIQHSYPSIRFFKQGNKGVSAARNHGIKKAQGQWIALIDSDDEWLPNKLEKQLALLKQNPDQKIIHSNEIWVRHGIRVNQMDKHSKGGGWIFQQCLPLCAISPSAVMIHRNIFDDVGLFDESLPACEDYELWLRITSRYPVLYSKAPLIKKYGGHDDQLSQKHWGMDRFRLFALDKILSSGQLTPDNQSAATAMLHKKCKILMNGAKKRNNYPLIKECELLIERWRIKEAVT